MLEKFAGIPCCRFAVGDCLISIIPHSKHFGLFSVPAPSRHLGVRRGFFIGVTLVSSPSWFSWPRCSEPILLNYVLVPDDFVFHNRWMATQTSQRISPHWQLRDTTAVLETPQLAAAIDLLSPQTGLSQLIYDDIAVSGFVLGVSPGASVALTKQDLRDVFQRGSDLACQHPIRRDERGSDPILRRLAQAQCDGFGLGPG